MTILKLSNGLSLIQASQQRAILDVQSDLPPFVCQTAGIELHAWTQLLFEPFQLIAPFSMHSREYRAVMTPLHLPFVAFLKVIIHHRFRIEFTFYHNR